MQVHPQGKHPLPDRWASMESVDPVLIDYLSGPGPHKLEIGAGQKGKAGWLATDLRARPVTAGAPMIVLDARNAFPVRTDSFDYVYSEHMIEHIAFDEAQNMLVECNRILKPGGVLRIVTPSLGFLMRIISSDRSAFEDRYREWSVTTFNPDAPRVTNAFFLNNFMRNWGHTFIYDRETLMLAMQLAGLQDVKVCDINVSRHSALSGLEKVGRMPPGYLELESMVMEGTKGPDAVDGTPVGVNLALRMSATQSSISKWSRESTVEKDASRVVSGVFSGTYNCHTDMEDMPWWRVDLEKLCCISQIRIYNRVADPLIARRTNRFQIQISTDDKEWECVYRKDDDKSVRGVTKAAPFSWVPDGPLYARYVRIQLLGRQFLHLEQVEIFGAVHI